MSRRPIETLARALEGNRVLVVGGSGGVGKTTTAAALALQAALDGRRVLVCTIDPSRRLATSLGLDRLRDKPREMDLSRLGGRGEGGMWAMMLDTKRTFDALVVKYAPSEAAKKRILENRLYEQISSALAGSHEYMAMEKLLELSADPRFDLIVLDTPPTRHALDFLEAPERMMDVLDTSVLKWLLKPYFAAGRLTLKIATKTGAIALKLADAVVGMQFLQDLSEFALAFEELYGGFQERAEKVHHLLRAEGSGFVLVASPAPLALDEALFFYRRLVESRMPFVSFVVNRVHPDPAEGHPPSREPVDLDDELAEALVDIFQDQRRLAKAERKSIAHLEETSGEEPILVPEFEEDVHDLRGLRDIADVLFSGIGTAAETGRRRRGRARARAAAQGER